ncbi:MAG: ABC transporter permease [Bacteroidaceae bacterium]|nr:ABC transporter permease [Bacteroidaceae bacterium]
MKQLYYVIQTLMHGRGSNVIKIISLGLGLTMSILLFSRVAYEQSFDTCFKDNQNLYQLWIRFSTKAETFKWQEMCIGKLAGGIFEAFPDKVESATTINHWLVGNPLYNGEVKFDDRKILADSLFFQTMGIEVISGNPIQDLQQSDVIYLSDDLANRMFGGENPIGKVISFNKKIQLTVRGTYADIPANSTVHPKAVISMPSVWKRGWGNYSWEGGDSWPSYLRIMSETDIEALNKQVNLLIQQDIPSDIGFNMEAEIRPIRDTYRNYDDVKRMSTIMTILASAILFITSLNYVLISISSLSRRAKAIGVHKCSGAEKGTIFGMFILETGITIVISLLLMGFLILNFQDFVEDTASTKLASLFALDRIWVSLSVVSVLFLIGGVLPGYIFSKIPVTQVFKRYTEGKKGWKRPLLFVQFAGVAFIGGIMIVVMFQFHHVLNKDMGYNPERIAAEFQYSENYDTSQPVKSFYKGLPYVEAVTSARENAPLWGYSGELMFDEKGKSLFSTRYDYLNEDYTDIMGIQVKQGRVPREGGEVAANETWLMKRGWNADEAIGKTIETEEGKVKIVGIIKDFQIGNFFEENEPFLIHYQRKFSGMIHLRLKEPFAENLQKLNKEAGEAFPNQTIEFESLEQALANSYNSVRVFRNAMIVATFVIIFITLMGLIGYTNDETQRRSKEIAIRKVNGAEASGIIELLAKDVLWTALPAVLIGTFSSWYVGEQWMSQFSTTMGSTIPYYMCVALVTLLMIVGVVVVKTWKIANENPVISIKSE